MRGTFTAAIVTQSIVKPRSAPSRVGLCGWWCAASGMRGRDV